MTTSDPPPSSSSSPTSSRGERRRRRKRVRKDPSKLDRRSRMAFLAFTVAGVALALLASYVFVVFPNAAGPGDGKDVEVVIDLDEPRGSVVDKLVKAGLVKSPTMFGLWVRLTGPHFSPGRHLLTDDASAQELVRRLERLGAATRAKVTIPEGWNRFDIARRLKALHVAPEDAFIEATQDHELLVELAIDAESAEGYLFPATYELPHDSDAKDVVRRMKGEFDRRFAQLEQNHHLGRLQLEATLGWSRKEILTLASMVEKEAAVDDERPIVASVFLNRLRDPSFKKKILQCDPTAGYGCLVMKDRVPSCAGYTGKITHAINMDPLNRYSTYVHEGLPPGPIGNPGMKSLQAVLAPAQTKYLYFVAREGRRHTFSETLDEHNAAVKDLRDRTSNREHAP